MAKPTDSESLLHVEIATLLQSGASWSYEIVHRIRALVPKMGSTAIEEFCQKHLRRDPLQNHLRCLELQRDHPQVFLQAAQQLAQVLDPRSADIYRIWAYCPQLPLKPEAVPSYRFESLVELARAAAKGPASFVEQLPGPLYRVLWRHLDDTYWELGGWTPALQAKALKYAEPECWLRQAMICQRPDEVKLLLDKDFRRQGYEAAWFFLQGQLEEAYRAFQKLIARRRPEMALFNSWVATFARLTALAYGDQVMFHDRRLACQGYYRHQYLLDHLDSSHPPDWLSQPTSGVPTGGVPTGGVPTGGLAICLAQALRPRTGWSFSLPAGLLSQWQAAGLEAMLDQLQEVPQRPWYPRIGKEPEWETLLRLLNSQADLGAKKTSKSPAKSSKGALYWVITEHKTLEFHHDKDADPNHPPEQLAGKAANTRSLLTRVPAYLTDQDRAALASAKLDGYGEVPLSLPLLRALAGHPRVYFQEQRRSLQEKLQRLLVVRKAKGFQLLIEPQIPQDDAYWLELEENQLVFWVRSPAEAQLRPLLSKQVVIPKQAEAELKETLLRWTHRIDIDLGQGSKGLAHGTSPAELRLRIRPGPRGGLRFDWVARCDALPDYCRPALEGMERELVAGEGQTLMVHRDLASEASLYGQFLAQCPALPDASAFRTDQLEEILEILSQCRQAQIPLEWPEGQEWKVTQAKALKLSASQSAQAESENWFALEGELQLEGQGRLELGALLKQVQLGQGNYLKLGDNEFVLMQESLRQQLEQLHDLVDPETMGISGLLVPSLAALEVSGFTSDEAFQARLEQFEQASGYQPQVPALLQAELRDYQVEGFRWLARHARAGSGACLADDMGLGKTLQTIALLLHTAQQGPHLVVCPVSVMSHWAEQLEQFAPSLRPILYEGKERSTSQFEAGEVVILSYGVLLRDGEKLQQCEFAVAVLDEAQAIKNPESKTARSAFGLKARARVATTGTPIENRLSELWSLFTYLNPGLLGNLRRFRRRFEEAGPNRARLKSLVAPFILRRLKSQVLKELPPRTEMAIAVELSPAERTIYEEVRQNAQQDIEAGEVFKLLGHLTRLRQACCHPELLLQTGAIASSSKVEALLELLDNLRAGHHRVLIFSQFTSFLDLVQAQLQAQQITFQRLDGSTSAAERKNRVAAFQSGEGEVFLISLKAGGTGLNLTAADYVVHLDPWWNPAAEDQASDRAHRIGQTRPVTVYRLIASNTIEEKVVKLHGHKRQLAESVLAGSDQPTQLDAQALRDLLHLA